MDADHRISQQIESRLTRDRRINLDRSEIAIDCRDGMVTLTGTVPTVAAKRLAVRLAGEVERVREVSDRLRVSTWNRMGDRELAEHVRNAFIQERNLEENRIEIDTDSEGEVILRGTVHSQIQVRLCEVLCWWVPGTTSVDNRLLMDPPEADSDEELKDNLEVIFEKDVMVNPKKFRIDVIDRRVVLRGTVDSETEKDAAEKDCWYTPGVVDVSNELIVG